jgi:hypothetical protein
MSVGLALSESFCQNAHLTDQLLHVLASTRQSLVILPPSRSSEQTLLYGKLSLLCPTSSNSHQIRMTVKLWMEGDDFAEMFMMEHSFNVVVAVGDSSEVIHRLPSSTTNTILLDSTS